MPLVQLTSGQRNVLEKQQYRFVGSHSAVKVCYWTKSMMKNEGGCYKFVFYGIRSHQCLQMTTSLFCANRCTFCWRGQKAPVSESWYGPIDEPSHIIKHAIDAHLGLLVGLEGNDKVPKRMKEEYRSMRHVALSLTGEPITYPRLNELLEEFHRRKISTFLVTNAQFPEAIENIKNVTQLYLSVDAPTQDLLKDIDRPLFKHYYERLLKSLDAAARKKFRTCIRLTIIKGKNDLHPEGYAELIKRGDPDFIEVKAYMHVGASLIYHSKEQSPEHSHVKAFALELLNHLPEYELVSEHLPSKVVLLVKKEAPPYRFIDFQKFFEIVNSGGEAKIEDYGSKKMMAN